jgi:transcriptional regulator with XRE-family HTH domain
MDMFINVDVIKAGRTKRAWSQEQLAGASGLGVRTIQRVEATGSASNETIQALAAVLECSVSDLIQAPAQNLKRIGYRFAVWSAIASAIVVLVGLSFMRADAGEVMLDVTLGADDPSPKVFKLITEEGQSTEARVDKEVRLILTPTIEKSGRILLTAEVYRYDGSDYRLVSTPKVLTAEGVDAQLDVGMGDGKHLEIHINPKSLGKAP